MTTHLITHLSTLFFLGSPAPGARPRGLAEHPPALPAPLRGPSHCRALAFSPPTLPSHHRGGASVRRLVYVFPPSHPLCGAARVRAGPAFASRSHCFFKKTVVRSYGGAPDRSASAYCQQLFCRGLFAVLLSGTVPRLPSSLPPTPCPRAVPSRHTALLGRAPRSELTPPAAHGRRGTRKRKAKRADAARGEKGAWTQTATK